ncbi:MAG: hypothetical protein ABI687_13695 [Flavitalea sp.]
MNVLEWTSFVFGNDVARHVANLDQRGMDEQAIPEMVEDANIKPFKNIYNGTRIDRVSISNIALAIAADSGTINNILLISFGYSRRITPGFRINNKLCIITHLCFRLELLHIRSANIFRPFKSCQTTIQWFTLTINAVAENLASRRVFAGRTLISALSFRVAWSDLV